MISTTLISLVNSLVVLLKSALLSVPFVARMPILFELVCNAAGFIAGSIPIIGVSYLFLRTEIAFVVAVLQATIIILHFKLSSLSTFLILSAIMSSAD